MGERIALTDASDQTHAALRARYAARRDAGYAGADYRVYGYMRVADAVRYYGAIHARWDSAQLAADLEATGLSAGLEVRRMKTVYQRALVLALIAAAQPATLVIERADQFDAQPAAELLERVVRRAPWALVTYASDTIPPAGLFDLIVPAGSFDSSEPAESSAAPAPPFAETSSAGSSDVIEPKPGFDAP